MLALSRPASLAARRSMSGQRVAGRKCQLSHSSRPAVAASAHASLLAQLASDVAESLPALSEEAQAAAKAAEQLAANKSGFLGGIANVLEGALESIDGVLSAAHVPYSYGFSIIVLTVFVKALTFPLSKKQIESTTAMQALQPRVKDLQVCTARAAGARSPATRPWLPPLTRTLLPRRATPRTRTACSARRPSCTRRLA